MSGDKDTYARILNRMKKKLDRNMAVLELACGTGILSVQDAASFSYAPGTFDAVVISNALHIMPEPEKALAEEGYVFADDTHEIHLTEKGKRIAEDTYERHSTFCRLLTGLGVDEKTAAADACEMEHAVSPESYEALKTLAKETLCEE